MPSYEERKELYQQLSELRERPLISFVTSHRGGASGKMAADSIHEFVKHLKHIDDDAEKIDILIVSNGGDPNVSLRIISLLRERFKKIGVLLPYSAYSAATLLALGADEILMHKYANMGPVDPQITLERKQEQGGINQFGAEDLRHYLNFLKEDVGITDQDQLEKAFEYICKEIGALSIGVAKRSSELMLSLGEKLLSQHLSDNNKVKAITESLNKEFYHHGYPLGRKEAKDIGLPIKDPSEDIEKLMWQIWENFEEEMECRKPFRPLEIAFANPDVERILTQNPVANIPSNIPQQTQQQILQQIIQNASQNVPPVDFEIFQAAVETVSAKSHYKSSGKIFTNKNVNMNIGVNVVTIDGNFVYTEA